MKKVKNIIYAIFAAFFFVCLSSCQNAQLVQNVTIEAGSLVPDIADFYINPQTAGRYMTDMANIDTKKIGSVTVEIEIQNKKYTSVLTIKDTTPPKAKPVDLYIFHGNEISPEDLAAEIEDETSVSCAFGALPDYNKYGWQNVSAVLTDEGGNKTEIESRLYIFDKSLFDEFVFEVGVPMNGLTFSEFMDNHVSSVAGLDGKIEIEAGELPFSADEDIYFPSIGSYRIKLTLGGYSTFSTVASRDTIPPSGKPSPEYQYIFFGSALNPEDFVTEIEDATKVSCVFKDENLSYAPGWQNITVRLTDEGQNSAAVTSRYYVFDAAEELTIEAGTRNAVSERDFVKNYIEESGLLLEGAGSINFSLPGSYPVKLKAGKHEFPAVVKIQDTIPPTADVRNIWTYINKPVQATSFVYNIKDVSPVTIKYKTQPDFSVEGNAAAYIIIEDAYNNKAEFAAILTVVWDTAPPVISGELDRRVAEGGTLSYRAGVTVTDDYDQNVQLVVDSSQVNLNRAGVYAVIYSATDESGNRAEVTGYVTVFEINMALVNGMADELLGQIIKAGMSATDKARAIYAWVDGKMKYSATNTKREIAQRSYDCFTKGSGDCYTYMAASHVLLTRAGIDNRIVQRIPEASSAHYWNLVNTGSGWYHFDVCPTPSGAVGYDERFMFTESQAQSYTQLITGRDHYYDYDKSTVPEVVE
ncbi:MAG: hypothetical protein FWD23_02400 [Oscillospiraceae bacterium]|nr:hypothetical protein [Oscillospiraceae bacterium]